MIKIKGLNIFKDTLPYIWMNVLLSLPMVALHLDNVLYFKTQSLINDSRVEYEDPFIHRKLHLKILREWPWMKIVHTFKILRKTIFFKTYQSKNLGNLLSLFCFFLPQSLSFSNYRIELSWVEFLLDSTE